MAKMPDPIDPFIPTNAMLNLRGAATALFGMFDPKRGAKAIDPIIVAYYCGVMSCRRDDVVISAAQHKAISEAQMMCMAFARNPDDHQVDLRRRGKIAMLLSRAIGDEKYE